MQTQPTSTAPGPPLNCWIAPGFEPLLMLKDFLRQLHASLGHIEQSYLYLDHASSACWCAIAQQQDYALAQQAMPIHRAVRLISRLANGRPIDVLGLGCGDGHNEIRLTQQLLPLCPELRLLLLDISQPLLSVAYRNAAETLAYAPVPISAIQGNFHHLPRYPYLLGHPNRCHLLCLFGGTFANLDDEVLFLQRSLGRAAPGDLLLLDTSLVTAPVSQPEAIERTDPRLTGQIPSGWQVRFDEWLCGPLRRYRPDLYQIQLSPRLDLAGCPIPGSYAIEIRAHLANTQGQQADFSLFRVKRYDGPQLAQCLRLLGWSPIDGWRYGEAPHGRLLYLFQRSGS